MQKYNIEDSPYKIGQKVYIVTGIGKYEEVEVSYLSYWLCEDSKDEIIGIPKGIIITKVLFYDDYISPIDDCLRQIIYFNEGIIFQTEKEAKYACEFVPLNLELDHNKWTTAIGDRDTDIENCELPICCGDVSKMRSILEVCKQHGGLIKRDIKELEELSTGHGYIPPKNSVMEQIFLSLGLIIRDYL